MPARISAGLLSTEEEQLACLSLTEQAFRIVWSGNTWADAETFVVTHTPQVILVCSRFVEDDWFRLEALQSRSRSAVIVVKHSQAPSLEHATRVLKGDVTAREALRAAALESLGQVGVKEAQKALRSEMFQEALRQAGGNRRATARILGIDRRYVLKLLNEAGPAADARPLRPVPTAAIGRYRLRRSQRAP